MFIVFDLDDTLSDTSQRQHILDPTMQFESESDRWDKFFDECVNDKPVDNIIILFNTLVSVGYNVEIWTGRSDRVEKETREWLQKHVEFFDSRVQLRMRLDGDYRNDIEIKSEFIERFGKPDIVFEDRNKMVEWWRQLEVTCLQVKESNF